MTDLQFTSTPRLTRDGRGLEDNLSLGVTDDKGREYRIRLSVSHDKDRKYFLASTWLHTFEMDLATGFGVCSGPLIEGTTFLARIPVARFSRKALDAAYASILDAANELAVQWREVHA